MNLTSVGTVKSWLNVQTTPTDALLQRLITSASNFILNYLSRGAIVKTSLTEIRSGMNETRLMLKNWPVLAVSAVQVGQVTIPLQTSLGMPGYGLDQAGGAIAGRPQSLFLAGYYRFCRGQGNVSIAYTAGYCVQNEAQTVPATSPYVVNVNCPNGPWAQDDGISYANGTALTPVAGVPSQGQYNVKLNTDTGVAAYTFNAADEGATLLMNYSFVPSDLEQACIELIGERFKVRDRIGQTSHTMAGAVTVGFSQKDMNDFIRDLLQPYKKVVPY